MFNIAFWLYIASQKKKKADLTQALLGRCKGTEQTQSRWENGQRLLLWLLVVLNCGIKCGSCCCCGSCSSTIDSKFLRRMLSSGGRTLHWRCSRRKNSSLLSKCTRRNMVQSCCCCCGEEQQKKKTAKSISTSDLQSPTDLERICSQVSTCCNFGCRLQRETERERDQDQKKKKKKKKKIRVRVSWRPA